jgi:putative membrane protein
VYFGVPLSNFAGWWLVGTTAVAVYAWGGGRPDPPGGGRVGAGIALYYAVLGFNLAVTVWIGEWRLLAVGLALHTMLALALAVVVRKAPARNVPGARGA